MSHEQLGWLRFLIVQYEQEHDWNRDEDASATREMLSQCRSLANDLGEWLPPEPSEEPARPHEMDDAEIPY